MEPKQWVWNPNSGVGIDVSGKRLEVFVRPIQRMLEVAPTRVPADPNGFVYLWSILLFFLCFGTIFKDVASETG
jgi:hypothetical protein